MTAGLVRKIGFFDEAYYPTLIDDIDYCVRAKRAGFKVIYYTGASVVHLGSASLSRVAYFGHLGMLYTNLMRFRLLYGQRMSLIPSLIEMFFMCLFRRVDNRRTLSLGNLAFQNLPGAHLRYLVRAITLNLRRMPNILARRIQNSVYVAPLANPDPVRGPY